MWPGTLCSCFAGTGLRSGGYGLSEELGHSVTVLRELDLVLFFTRGVSLLTWDQVGMFEREVALYRRLRAHGIRVTFATYGNASDLTYADRLPGIRILCNRWGLAQAYYERWLPWLHAPWLWRAGVFKTNQTDGAKIALRTARLWRKPLIARCGYMWSEFASREHGPHSAVAQLAHGIESQVFVAAQRVVVTTPTMAADLARRIPLVADRTVVIPNYVDTELFHPAIECNREHDVIFVGRISPQKNIAALLEAIQPLDVQAMLIGNGELRDELRRRFAGLNGRVWWLSSVSNAELPSYLNRAALFVLPSHFEGHPKVLIEAMACGLPVIGADSPGIRELIRHGETGWLCDTDPASVRAAIEELLVRPELCAQLGHKARQFVVENFSLERIVQMELDMLSQVIA